MANNTIRMETAQQLLYEKAVQSMDKYQYNKAIKMFEMLIKREPNNAEHYCNLAGAFAESGDFAASNEKLQFVLENIDANRTECYFYMANNFANMEEWEPSEQAIVYYLENDDEGEYIDDCQEMLDFFVSDLRRKPVTIKHIKSRKGYAEHDEARLLLESGKFQEAIEKLTTLIQTNPDFLAAYNNLALAYYYIGEYELSEQAVNQVLSKEPDNLHGLCNRAILLHHDKEEEQLDLLLKRLSKLKPMYADHLFKLATTMGMLGRDQVAYELFVSISKSKFQEIEIDSCFYHYTAVAAFNLGHLFEARKWWAVADKSDPGSQIPKFYLFHLDRWMSNGEQPQIKMKYHFQLPFSDMLRKLFKRSKKLESFNESEELFVMHSFAWALQNGEKELRKLVSEGLTLIGDQSVNRFLSQLGLIRQKPWVDWPESWASVIELSLFAVKDRIETYFSKDMESLWIDFYQLVHDEKPNLTNPSAWSAALQYVTSKMHDVNCTFTELASRHNVSPRAISRCAEEIVNDCKPYNKWDKLYNQLASMMSDNTNINQEEFECKK